MNVAEIKYFDIANGAGVRTTVFVSGCRHHCPGCFNEEAWDFAVGEPFTEEVENKIFESLEPPYVDGLSVLGGEPLEPENQHELAPFLERVRERFPNKDIWMWTGFVFEDLLLDASRAHTQDLSRVLACVDVLVDGPFILAQKDITLRFRGSANQRILDLKTSLEKGGPCLWSDGPLLSSHGLQ